MSKGKTKESKDHNIEFKTKIINKYYEYNKSYLGSKKKVEVL